MTLHTLIENLKLGSDEPRDYRVLPSIGWQALDNDDSFCINLNII